MCIIVCTLCIQSGTIYFIFEIKAQGRQQRCIHDMYVTHRQTTLIRIIDAATKIRISYKNTCFNKVELVTDVFRGIPWWTQLFIILGQPVEITNWQILRCESKQAMTTKLSDSIHNISISDIVFSHWENCLSMQQLRNMDFV